MKINNIILRSECGYAKVEFSDLTRGVNILLANSRDEAKIIDECFLAFSHGLSRNPMPSLPLDISVAEFEADICGGDHEKIELHRNELKDGKVTETLNGSTSTLHLTRQKSTLFVSSNFVLDYVYTANALPLVYMFSLQQFSDAEKTWTIKGFDVSGIDTFSVFNHLFGENLEISIPQNSSKMVIRRKGCMKPEGFKPDAADLWCILDSFINNRSPETETVIFPMWCFDWIFQDQDVTSELFLEKLDQYCKDRGIQVLVISNDRFILTDSKFEKYIRRNKVVKQLKFI